MKKKQPMLKWIEKQPGTKSLPRNFIFLLFFSFGWRKPEPFGRLAFRFIHFCFFIYRVTSLCLPCGRYTSTSFEAVTCSARPLRVAFFRVRRRPTLFALSPRCFYGMYKEIFVADSLSLLLTPRTMSIEKSERRKRNLSGESKRGKYLNTSGLYARIHDIFFNRCISQSFSRHFVYQHFV